MPQFVTDYANGSFFSEELLIGLSGSLRRLPSAA